MAKSKNLGLIRIMYYHMKKGKMAKKKLPTKGGYNPHAKVHEELIRGRQWTPKRRKRLWCWCFSSAIKLMNMYCGIGGTRRPRAIRSQDEYRNRNPSILQSVHLRCLSFGMEQWVSDADKIPHTSDF